MFKENGGLMKKAIILFIFIINVLALSGCDPSSYHYNYEDLVENVVSIELINYENDEAAELFEKREKVKPFDFSKLEVIEVLENEKNDQFLSELSKIDFLLVWRHLDSPKGEGIKVNYKDGSFDIICYYVQFSCQYDELGNVKEFIGSGGGNQLKKIVDSLFLYPGQ